MTSQNSSDGNSAFNPPIHDEGSAVQKFIDLDQYPPHYLLTEGQAASAIGVKPSTLAVWRCNGRYDLPYLKIGRNVRYKVRDTLAYLDRQTVNGKEGGIA